MSHVAVAIPGLDRIGGAERQAITLAKGLRRRGWRVSMIALSGSGGAAATELRDAGVEFLSLEMRRGLVDPRGWIRFHRWLLCERPDVIHAHLPHAAWLARWSRIAAPVPVVVDTLHSSSTGEFGRRIGYGCSRWLADCVTAVSHATAETHLAAGMVSESQLSVLANGIDIDAWKPDVRRRASIRHELGFTDEFLWLAVGRLEPAKDYATLLRALARLPENARLVVLGGGLLECQLRQLSAQLRLGQRIQLLGFESNVHRWMQAADGFVLSSKYEGLPMVLLEAGACELPVVATDVAGTREVITHGENGLLAHAGDGFDLSAAMERMMHLLSEERHAMGKRARRCVVDRFNLETILSQWESLYAELLERKTARSVRLNARAALKRASATSA